MTGAECGKRRANFELLRVLAMVMVVVMHFLTWSDNLPVMDKNLDEIRIVGALLEAFCLVAVNVYVFISGYFGVNGSFRPSKAIRLLAQIWFYALLVWAVFVAAGMPTALSREGIYGLIQYLFPIETEHYWFATAYFMLYLLTPVLNAAAKNMSKRQMQIMIGALLILFSGIKSVSPVVFVFDRYGYDLSWFICVYLVAAYCSLYGFPFFEKRRWSVYVGSALAGFGIHLSMWALGQRWDCFHYYFTVPFHYNFILCLTGTIGLFYGFSHIHIKEGKFASGIRKMGSLCFGVYLLHEHIDLRALWYGWMRRLLNPGGKEGLLFFLWELFGSVVILFAAGIIIDWIRERLFSVVAAAVRKTKIYFKIMELDRAFAEK